MDPLRVELLDAVYDPQHGFRRGEDAGLAVALTHLLAQVLPHDRRLVTPMYALYVKGRGKEAARRVLQDHYRVPVGYARGFGKAQLSFPEAYGLALPKRP